MDFTIAPIVPALAEALGQSVSFADDCTGAAAVSASENLANGEIMLCENVRFYPGEEANDAGFAAELAKLGDVYVNDAFSAAHRAHASTAAITTLLPAFAGPLMAEEIAALTAALEDPKRPAIASLVVLRFQARSQF